MNRILTWLSASAKKYNESAAFKEALGEVPADVELIPNLPYSGALAADLYRPAAPGESALPVAVMVHGGGLFAGDRTANLAFCVRLARTGYLVFALEYRLIDQVDSCGEISDLCAGFDFVQETLAEYGGDPRGVAVMAESAGAYLALYATALARSETLGGILGCPSPRLPVRALVCFSGMFYTARPDLIGLVYRRDLYGSRSGDKEIMELMNPEHPEIITHLPPVFLTSSRGDFLRDYSLRYARALRKAGHPCELVYYPEGKHLRHAFPSQQPALLESREVLVRLNAWLNTLSSKNDF